MPHPCPRAAGAGADTGAARVRTRRWSTRTGCGPPHQVFFVLKWTRTRRLVRFTPPLSFRSPTQHLLPLRLLLRSSSPPPLPVRRRRQLLPLSTAVAAVSCFLSSAASSSAASSAEEKLKPSVHCFLSAVALPLHLRRCRQPSTPPPSAIEEEICAAVVSEKIPSRYNPGSLSQLPQAKRGTPCYMAPELFQEGGVHSYASDLWALGCVLHECYAGRPPFVADEFSALVESILSDPVPPLPDNPSKPFCNLVNHLLVKDPAERIQWSELCGHGFWRTKFKPLSLPPQPAFNIMVDQSRQSCLSERNIDRPPSQKASHNRGPKHRDGTIRHDENSVSATKTFEVSSKSPPSSKKLQTKGSCRVGEKHRDASATAKGANILRLSRIAKKNLQRENDNDNYRRPLPKASERDNDVKIENNDMELDFGEHNDEEVQDDSNESGMSIANSPLPDTQIPLPPRGNEKDDEISKTPSKTAFPPDNGESNEEESCPLPAEVAANTPAIGQKRTTRNALEMHKMEGGATDGSDSSRSINNLSQVLWHPSDLSVRPIMPSRKTEKAQETIPPLPFIVMPVTEF